jgi:hypothetical protein
MYNVTIIFNNGLQTSIEGVQDYGYRDDVFYVKKDDCKSFIPQDKILYIGAEKIQLENIVITD